MIAGGARLPGRDARLLTERNQSAKEFAVLDTGSCRVSDLRAANRKGICGFGATGGVIRPRAVLLISVKEGEASTATGREAF